MSLARLGFSLAALIVLSLTAAVAKAQAVPPAPADLPTYYSSKMVMNAKLTCSGQTQTCNSYCGGKTGQEMVDCTNECSERKTYCQRTGVYPWRQGVSVWVGSRD